MKLFLSLVFLIASVSSLAASFAVHPLTQAYQQQLSSEGLWKAGCPVPLTRFRDVTVSYYDFDGKPHYDGHLIVLDAVAPDVEAVFKELFKQHFPLKLVRPTSVYQGDDDASMAADNTSAFNCRPITGNTSGLPSIHAYGLAIDIDPVENPYISFDKDGSGKAQVLPAAGTQYVNRGLVTKANADKLVELFKQHGFSIWGGQWRSPIDYQHFQPSRFVAQMLAGLNSLDAKQFFVLAKDRPAEFKLFKTSNATALLVVYRDHKSCFMQEFPALLNSLAQNKNVDLLISTLKQVCVIQR